MRNNIFVLFSVFIVTVRASDDDDSWRYGSYYDKKNVTGQEDSEGVYRPCPTYDLNCIRKYLASRSKCKIVHGPIPDPLYQDLQNFYFPNYNLSTSQIGVKYINLRGEITEFLVDKNTFAVLLQVQFKNFGLISPQDVYRYHRTGKEDAITRSNSVSFFPSITTQTIFSGYEPHHRLDLAKSESVGNLDQLPAIVLNPSAAVHPDPVVAAQFAAFTSNIRVTVAEALLTNAPFLAGTYIQYVLCDYGLKIVV